jgi:hypothetical protein
MPIDELDALRPTLLAIPDAAVTPPGVPVAVALQEAHDLAVVLQSDAVIAPLLAVGLDAGTPRALLPAIAATRAAESEWLVTRDRKKSAAQRDREARGHALRAELGTTARWTLRGNPAARATLAAIGKGVGVADLIQDLHDLGVLLHDQLAAFAADITFDAPAASGQALALSAELAASTAAERNDAARCAAKDLRDRAFTHLSRLVSEIRDVGRYAHRNNPALAHRFTSAYERQRRQRHSAKRKKAAAVES